MRLDSCLHAYSTSICISIYFLYFYLHLHLVCVPLPFPYLLVLPRIMCQQLNFMTISDGSWYLRGQ